jgi:hypothetical protein
MVRKRYSPAQKASRYGIHAIVLRKWKARAMAYAQIGQFLNAVCNHKRIHSALNVWAT